MKLCRRWFKPLLITAVLGLLYGSWWTLKWKIFAVLRLYSLGFSPDGKRVAVGGLYGEMQLWDTQTGKTLARWQGS